MDVLTDEELAAQEDAAWDEHERRKAAEASEDAYDEYSQTTQDGEFPEAWRDEHMMREV